LNLEKNHKVQEDGEIIASLTARVSALLPPGLKPLADSPTRMQRNYSFLFRYSYYRDQERPTHLLVKIPRETWMTRLDQTISVPSLKEDARREYDVLHSIANIVEALEPPGFCAINVLAYLDDYGAIVMEELELRPLKALYLDKYIIMNSSEHWKRFENCLARAGELLRHIHSKLGDEKHVPLRETGAWSLVDREFSRLDSILPARSITKLRGGFELLYHKIETVESPVVTLHKDYHLGNIFLDGDDRIGILDPNWQAKGSIYEDLARLIVDPLTRKIQILSQGGYFRLPYARRFEKAVLSGYFGASQVDDRVLSFFSALMVLTLWRMNEESIKAPNSKVLHALLNRAFRIPLRRYFSRLTNEYLKRGLGSTFVVE